MCSRIAGAKIIALLALLIFPSLFSIQSAFGSSAPIVNIDPSSPLGYGPGLTPGFVEYQYNGMIGWSFNLQQPLTITQVGWYDQGQDGLSRAFQVGLWTGYDTGSVQQLLGTPDGGITIPAGTGAALNGVWRVVDLPVPLMLQPGSYALSGYDTADTTDVIDYVGPLSPAEIGAAPLVTIPGLTIGEPNWNPYGFPGEQSNGFQAPEGWLLVWGMELGPMLFTDDSPTITPEPATLGLLAVGLAALVARRKRAGK